MKTKFFTLLTMLVVCVGSMWADTTILGPTGEYTVSASKTTELPTSGNSGYYVLEQWNYANNSNKRYVEENNGKVRYTTASSPSVLTEAHIVLITNTGTAYTVQFVKTGNYIQNIASGKQATTGNTSSNLDFVASPQTGGYNIYNKDSNTDQLFFTLQGNNYPTGGTGRWGWGTFALYSVTKSANYSSLVEAYIKPHFDNVGSYFRLTSTALSTYESDYKNYLKSCTEEQYNTLLTSVNALFSNPNNVYLPDDGNYLMKSSYGNYMYIDNGTIYGNKTSNDATSIVRLERQGSTNTYKIAIQGAYLNTPTQSADVTYGGEGAIFTAVTTPSTVGKVAFKAGDGTYGSLHTSSSQSYRVVGWTVDAGASQWTIEDATSISIPLTAANDNTGTAHTYATLCVPFAITNLTGNDSKEVKAYAPTIDGNYIVPGDGATTITEGTPVMLIGEEGSTTVTATIGSDYATSPATTNALRGTFTGTSIDCTAETGTNYVLGFDRDNDNRIGFYHVNSSSYNLKANRAYLNLSTGGDARGFYINFDDVVTGISSMDNGQWTMDNESVIYNLSGQRLNKMQKGINIVNGKKVLF